MAETDPAQQERAIAARGIGLRFDPDCGMIRDLTLHEAGRTLRPMHRVPWAGEALPADCPPHLWRMEGDFFCAPFATGAGSAPLLHGWPANALWQVTGHSPDALTARLGPEVQGARLTKHLRLRDGHPFLYQSHRFEGGAGRISAANHAMVSLPGGGLISTSAKAVWRTPAAVLEPDPARGRSALAGGARAADPRAFPAADGGRVDLTCYPFRAGHEDFVIGLEQAGTRLGWTAVVRLGQGDLFLSLRNPAVLPMTMLWHSDGGRDYAPWSGRHRACLGVEEGAAPDLLDEPGGLVLGGTVDVRHAIGCIAWPQEERVAQVVAGPDHLTITAASGAERRVPFDPTHLFF